MEYQTTIQQVREAIERYGPNGDKSFECVGLSVNKNGLVDFKVYRLYRRCICSPPAEIEAPALKSTLQYLSGIECRKKFRIFDFSVRTTAEKTWLRYAIRMNCGIPIEQYRNNYSELLSVLPKRFSSERAVAISNCIETAISPNRGALIILGAEMEESALPVAVKSYYSLRRYESYHDPRFVLADAGVVEELLQKCFDICGIERQKLLPVIRTLQKAADLNCYPFMLGMTEKDDSVECKVYCLCNPIVQRTIPPLLNTKRLINLLANSDDLEKNLEKCLCETEKMGLFLKGFAVSASGRQEQDMEYKIYLMPSPYETLNQLSSVDSRVILHKFYEKNL